MLVIILTVLTQGPRVGPEYRGNLRGELFVNSGFFQAVGVISFLVQNPVLLDIIRLTGPSICVPPQLPPDLRLTQNTNHRPILDRHSLQYIYITGRVSHNGTGGSPQLRQPD